MPFCATCGSQVEGRFCAKCGAAVGASPTPGAAPGAMPPPPMGSSAAMADNVASALCYALGFITGIIFLVLEPYNRMRLVKFHSIQSLALAVAWIAIWIGITILHVVMHFIPFIGVLFLLLDLAVSVGFFIAWLIAILKASKGEYFKLPIIGDFAEKQANT